MDEDWNQLVRSNMQCIESVSSNGFWVGFWSDNNGGIDVEIDIEPGVGEHVLGMLDVTMAGERITRHVESLRSGVIHLDFSQASGTLDGSFWLYGATATGNPAPLTGETFDAHATIFNAHPWFVWTFQGESTGPFWFSPMDAVQVDAGTIYEPETRAWNGQDYHLEVQVEKYFVMRIVIDIPDAINAVVTPSRCTQH